MKWKLYMAVSHIAATELISGIFDLILYYIYTHLYLLVQDPV